MDFVTTGVKVTLEYYSVTHLRGAYRAYISSDNITYYVTAEMLEIKSLQTQNIYNNYII